jgi:hypothetical protein
LPPPSAISTKGQHTINLAALGRDLGIPTVWVTHSYASCSQHASDEPMLAPVARDALGVTRMPATGRMPNAQR